MLESIETELQTYSSSSVDELMDLWETKLGFIGAAAPTLDAFLDLSVYDMRNAALNIDCPYCRRHMLLEAEEIAQVLQKTRKSGNVVHSHGLGERLRTLMKSFVIVVNVLLGGLRRAKLI